MDELLARQLPQSAEAEQAVIGSMLIDPECIPVVIEQLRPDDFYTEENRRIFETIYSMFNNAMRIDAVTVLDQLKSAGLYDDAGGRAYLMQLMDVTPTAAGVREYAAIVRDKSMLRAIAQAGAEIEKLAFEGGGTAAKSKGLATSKPSLWICTRSSTSAAVRTATSRAFQPGSATSTTRLPASTNPT